MLYTEHNIQYTAYSTRCLLRPQKKTPAFLSVIQLKRGDSQPHSCFSCTLVFWFTPYRRKKYSVGRERNIPSYPGHDSGKNVTKKFFKTEHNTLSVFLILKIGLKLKITLAQGTCFIESPLLFLVQSSSPQHTTPPKYWFFGSSDSSLRNHLGGVEDLTRNKSGLSIKHVPWAVDKRF